ncbi:Deoxyribose-phosphate aldolase [Tenacibaculum sp. 190130A14a]|uniref:Deoxyribose-phosphate aldolase n=1 Tax=Tenacibaculum polynesiense TaxID=3137857 RepID=A0ABP1F371_9FLAO
MRYTVLVVIALILQSCTKEYTAQEVVDHSIKAAKLDVLNEATLAFNFRNKAYKAVRNKGIFTFTKEYQKDSVHIKDVLSNNGFERFVNDSLVSLSEKDKGRFGNAVNSVHYFSILPLGLNDSAVQKKLLAPVTIKGKEYFKIQVTFSEEGGGDDFDDVFIYWFAKDSFTLDYMAYKYHTNGGGVRFRDVLKEHTVKGIRLVDYNNYKPTTKDIDFFSIDALYEAGALQKVSEIVLEDIKVN